jgi:uncharacterized membrane protein (DUF106 family)
MEETATPQVSLFQHAAKWGAIFGVGSIVLTILLYVVDYTLLANWKMIFLLLVFLGLVIYAGVNYRNQIGGFLPYGKAFQHGFIVFAVLGIITTLFTVILYMVIDTELPAKLTEVTIENTQKMMEGFGVPEDKMDEAMEKARENAQNQFSGFGLVKGYGIALIFYAILSLISAIFVRKNQPEEMM